MAKTRLHGEGYISKKKRKDGRYEGRIPAGVDENGKRRFIAVYGQTKQEVKEKLDELTKQRKTHGFLTTKKILFGDWLDDWLNNTMKIHLKDTTFCLYETLIRVHIKPILGQTQLAKLQVADLERLYKEKLECGRIQKKGKKVKEKPKGLAPKTVKQIHNVIHQALQRAFDTGLVTANVSDKAKLPKLTQKQVESLSPEHIQALLKQIENDRLRAAYILTLKTGLRRGELLALKWSDVNWAENTISVNKSLVMAGGKMSLHDTTKTARGMRLLYIDDDLIAELKRHKARQAEERLKYGDVYESKGLIFAYENGEYINPNTFRQRFKRVLKNIGIEEKRFHDLRHTFASLLIQNGIDVLRVSAFLGHAKPGFTLNTYSHVIPGKMQETAVKINSLINDLMPDKKQKNKISDITKVTNI